MSAEVKLGRVWRSHSYQSCPWGEVVTSGRPLVFALWMFAVWHSGPLMRLARIRPADGIDVRPPCA